MKDYFLITSFTGGNHSDLKVKVAQKLIESIRKYFEDSFIVFVDSNLSKELAPLSDIYIIEKNNNNSPHGQGTLDKTKIGINILEKYNAPFFYKFEYDFHIDEVVFKKIKQWKNLIINYNKKIVSSRWIHTINDPEYMHKSISAAFGCYNTQSAKSIYDFNIAEYPIEMQLYKIIKKKLHRNECIIYGSVEEALGTKNFDIFNGSGKVFDQKKLKAIEIDVKIDSVKSANQNLPPNNVEVEKNALNTYSKIIFFIKKIYNYIKLIYNN